MLINSSREKMAFFTSVRASVPMYQEESDDDTCSESSTLQSSADPARQLSSALSTPTPAPLAEDQDTALREGFSTETVNTITEGDEEANRSNSSQNSTPTPNVSERFSYEVDPELGAFV